MSDQIPYETLGVSEEATFDEIQDARSHLIHEYRDDSSYLEIIEAAYDAILMERLRMRQEGTIKVPECIRFPERLVQVLPKETSLPREQSHRWFQKILAQPSSADVILPGLWFAGLSAISLFYPTGSDVVLQLVLISGIGVSIYFINRKEGKLGRSVLIALFTLVFGLVSGELTASLLSSHLSSLNLAVNQFSTIVSFILLWLVSSFLR
ncbi:DnaJ-class molecular chaperone [Richelia intracellularis HH01]|uniref:DnaJ-class molecular chaperone n=1 Tax=Richelia intracellularis HH01 TaxID=1165094 RepID=M1X4P6_9NOST|nr:CPP1-like family protein [Richelia intracellularis]CCH66511.1 DnaJ-class molecular chaperone [Richelia intracellularis HH01]HAE05748.1 molecular chaperone DnaJ [Richelia sp.]